jgi:hypothetical protein
MNILKLAGTTLIAGAMATASFAGTLTEPEVMEVEAVEENSNSSGIWLPLLALVVVAAIIATDDDDSSQTPVPD